MDYRQVTIYVDKNKNLIAVANGLIDKWGGIISEIDVVEQLNFPYEPEEVEQLLIDIMGKCHSLIPEEGGFSPLEKLLGVKGYAKAVKGKKLIKFAWRKDHGYYISPSIREKKGFVTPVEKEIMLGETIGKGALAAAVEQAINDSTMI